MTEEQEDTGTVAVVGERSLAIFKEIDSSVALEVIATLIAFDEENSKPIKIWLNTPGGSVIDAMSICDVIEILSSPVDICVTGYCASAGLLILLSATGKRIATRNSRFYHHSPVAIGQSISLQMVDQYATQYRWALSLMHQLIKEQTSLPEEIWKAHFEHATAYEFGFPEAHDWGFVDHRITDTGDLINGKQRKRRATKRSAV
jgi:ATP-dependent Clp protease, protease subunit